ncbi:centlein-like [Anneissia japonica]|uniref:centlein-like n=1 Tax=Anneissia japonica TaxID=1529436 RepID=UPI0014259791|nr:centlein-like [Anneissia japonica]
MDSLHAEQFKDEIRRLQTVNQALQEELTQVQADKEFVWSLWRRMQVANPNIAQAVGMVVQREKEKSEMKDRKVLQILQVKDDQIAENSKVIAQLQQQLGEISSQSEHDAENREKILDLQTRNRELQLRKEEVESMLEEEITKSESREKTHTEELARITHEKAELELNIESLSQRVIKAQEEIDKLQEVRVKGLEKDVVRLDRRATQAEIQLKEKSEALLQSESKVMNLTKKVNKVEGDLHIARSELSEVRASHQQGLQHSAQQADLIRQLQALQHDTQKVIKSQEDVHHIHTSSYEKMYIELKVKYDKLVLTEKHLQQKLKELIKPVSTMHVQTQVSPGRSASRQVPLARGGGMDRQSRPRQRGQTFNGIGVQDMELMRQEPASRVRLEDKFREPFRRSQSASPSHGQSSSESLWRSDVRHELKKKERALEENYERKMSDLRKLLKLKNDELETMRKVHNKRFHRLKILQEDCTILREQISTYDEEELKPTKSRKHQRSNSKQLQQENSDTVWNELAYYKTKYTQLNKERIDIHEEVDRLRVQTASDATTIADLTRCLEQERLDLQGVFEKQNATLKLYEKENLKFEEQCSKNKLLKQQLQDERNAKEKLVADQLLIEREARTARADLTTAKIDLLSCETELQGNKQEIHRLRRKIKRKNKKWKQLNSDRMMGAKTPKQHQILLNKSISRMKELIPEFEDAEWEDVDSDSDGIDSSNTESLGQHIKLTASRMSANRSFLMESPKSPRELISVETFLRRMAKAYEGKSAEKTILMSVATQTERVQEAEMKILRDSLLEHHDETSSMTGSDVSSASTIIASSPKIEQQHASTSPHVPLTKLHKMLAKTYRSQSGFEPTIGSLKNRLASLQQQVAATKKSKAMLQKSVDELTEKCQQLQAELSLSNQRMKIGRQTIQRLTGELEESHHETELIKHQLEANRRETNTGLKQIKHSDTDWKDLESRIKSQSSELSRQSLVIKSLRSENDSQTQQIKILQDRINHNERDLNQKRSLMEDLKARVKVADKKDKSDNTYLRGLEDKLHDVTDACEKKKTEINSLRKRLATMTKEKHKYEELHYQLQEELKLTKADLRKMCTDKNEAEKTAVDLEKTAMKQLQNMTQQTEHIIASADKKLTHEVQKHCQLKMAIVMLAEEFMNQTKDARELVHQMKKSLGDRGKMDSSLTKAQSIASSILDLTASDVEELMTLEDFEEHKKLEGMLKNERRKDERWMKQLESLLNSQTHFAQKVFQMLMEKIIERDKLLSKVEERGATVGT